MPTNHPQYHNNGSSGDEYDYVNGQPWNHWKWKTYCDWTYIDPNDELYRNLNCINISASGPDRFGLQRYLRFCMYNGYLPAIKGQMVFGRDMNMDGAEDNFPDDLVVPGQSSEDYSVYPGYTGFYSKPAYQTGYDPDLVDIAEGSSTAGLHPDNLPDEPFTFVRQSTLMGIAAMVSDENAGNDAFDQVAFVTYGTRAFAEMPLSNDMDFALKMANNRLGVTAANLGIDPAGNGNTNIGGAIRMGFGHPVQ